MSDPTADSAIADLVRSFTGAPPDDLDAAYRRLVGALWNEGKVTEIAAESVPAVVAALDGTGPERQGRLAILLGLLAEAEYPRLDGEVATAVRGGLDRYLDLLRGGGTRQPLTLALLYLVAHFPGDRERVLAATADLPIDDEERSRLERGLAELDLENPDIGWVWPAPSAWDLTEEEAGATVRGLSPEQIATNWESDTRTVWASAGAIANWAVHHGPPAPLAVNPVPEWRPSDLAPQPIDRLFGERARLLRCPTCRSPIAMRESNARCEPCSTTYLAADGILDLSAGVPDGRSTAHEETADMLQKLSEVPKLGLYYEAVLRQSYLRLAGSNYGDQVTHADEDAYIAENLRAAEGPVVDLAAGAGRWTEVVAGAVGADRLTAVDMMLPMLNVMRSRLPAVPAVMGSALNLPFADGTIGAINLWNALQAFPDDAGQAIAEIGRCLRPGGILTMLTFRWSDEPIARYFQGSHYFASRPEGHLVFEREQLRQWLTDAGLTIRDWNADIGTFVFVTAERTA